MQDTDLTYKDSDLVRKGKADWYLKITAEDKDQNTRIFVPEISKSEWADFFKKYNGVPKSDASGKPLDNEDIVESKLQVLEDFAISKLERIKVDASYELSASQPERIRAAKTKEDIQVDQFTENLLSKIEDFQGDWQKPWFSKNAMVKPQSIDGHIYQGSNMLFLALHTDRNKFAAPVYGTFARFDKFNKGEENKGLPRVSVNKGEKSAIISTPPVYVIRNKETGEKISLSDFKKLSEEEKKDYFFRKFAGKTDNVFNIDQTNLKEARPEIYKKFMDKVLQDEGKTNDVSQMIAFPPVDKMISDGLWVCPINPTKGDEAYYSISKDHIVVPLKEQFKDGEAFYTNLFHEMAHSTGAESRLGRLKPATFGSASYAREELVAEITAAYVGLQNGLTKHLKEDTTAYVKNWHDTLKDGSLDTKKLIDDIYKAKDMVSTRIDEVDKEMKKGIEADYSRFRQEGNGKEEKTADNRTQEVAKMMEKMQSNIMEVGENIFHIGYDQEKNILYAGTATNAGVTREVEREYDYDLAYDSRVNFDKNITALHDCVEEVVADREQEEEEEEVKDSSLSR